MKRVLSLLLLVTLMLSLTAPSVAEQPKVYNLGDHVDNFTVTMFDGTEVSLYELLKEKKAVVLNFWASWCPPCKREFPFLQEVWDAAKDDAALLAFTGNWDDETEARKFQQEHTGYTFPMGMEPYGLMNSVQGNAYPTTAVIDRNGVLCFTHSGAFPSAAVVSALFSIYTADDYTDPVLLSEVPEPKLPDSVSAQELTAALCGDGSVSADNGDGMWPFLPDGEGVSASNANTQQTRAAMTVTVNAKAGDALAFDYRMAVDELVDSLIIYVNDERKQLITKTTEGWETAVLPLEVEGEAVVRFVYERGMNIGHTAEMKFKNVRLITAGAEAASTFPADAVKTLEGKEYEIYLLDDTVKAVNFYANGTECNFNLGKFFYVKTPEVPIGIRLGKDIDERFSGLEVVNLGLQSFYAKACVNMEPSQDGLISSINMGGDSALRITFLMMDEGEGAPASMTLISGMAGLQTIAAIVQQVTDPENPESVQVGVIYEDGTPFTMEDAGAAAEAALPAEATYVVHYVDEAGDPVPGVLTQWCDASTCRVIPSDEQGNSTMVDVPYAYEVHVLMAPAGYAPVTELFTMPIEGGEITITLTQA